MNAEVRDYLAQVKLGEAQTYKRITVVPLLGPTNGASNYLTMAEALDTGQFTVTEVSQSGSVPQLKVINQLSQPVLLLDGEELLGAKQNRVLTTTILLKENSETIVPVSCTEHGRWSYSSAKFSSSDHVMSHKSRMAQSHSVSVSLDTGGHFTSNQSEVWSHIADLHEQLGSRSATGAMRDAYLQRQADLEAALKCFPSFPGQSGLLVLMDGEVAGFDTVSRPDAYARLHPKLIKSYVIEALAGAKEVQADPAAVPGKAHAFLDETAQCEEKRFPSVGYGEDCRFRKAGLLGKALLRDGHPIHVAFFRMTSAPENGHMSALRFRRQRLDSGAMI